MILSNEKLLFLIINSDTLEPNACVSLASTLPTLR